MLNSCSGLWINFLMIGCCENCDTVTKMLRTAPRKSFDILTLYKSDYYYYYYYWGDVVNSHRSVCQQCVVCRCRGRYQYFLQLTKDMSEGRLVAPFQTTVLLASLAVQCECHCVLRVTSLTAASLPHDLQSTDLSLATFRNRLKTFLFDTDT